MNSPVRAAKPTYNSEDYCSVNVHRDTWLGSRCERKWKIEEDGKRYCTQHSPAKVKERRVASAERYAADSKLREIRYALDSGYKRACRDVPVRYLKDGILRKLIDYVYEMNDEKIIAELEGTA